MSTNSMIARKVDAGYECIYNHWDGYIAHLGVTLRDAYNTDELVASLIALGDCSSVSLTLDECEFYHRDRNANGNEKWENVKPCIYPTLIKAIAAYQNHYNYVWDDGEWKIYDRNAKPLSWDSDDEDED